MSASTNQFSNVVTIANGQSLSDGKQISIKGGSIVGIIMPATWTAADLTFQASLDGSTWYELVTTAGTAVSITAPAAATWIAINPGDFVGVPWLKVRSGTLAAVVAQGGARSITIVSRNV
jgi:hypothetical protein